MFYNLNQTAEHPDTRTKMFICRDLQTYALGIEKGRKEMRLIIKKNAFKYKYYFIFAFLMGKIIFGV